MFKKPLLQPISVAIFICFISINLFSLSAALNDEEFSGFVGPVVKKDQRKSLVVTEYGEISVIEIADGIKGPHHIQFITLEPNSLFLPVLLHADMVFYVHTGSGRLSWVKDEDLKTVDLKRGDIFRLQPGSVFYIECDLETEREKLRIYAIYVNPDDEDLHTSIGVYSSINDLVRGFDKRTLQAAFKVPEEVIQSITNATERRLIVHAGTKEEKEDTWELEARYLKALVGSIENKKKKKKDKAYNIRHAKPDFENCNGWSTTVTKKDSDLLKGSNIGIFMVNLTKGSMMGPHWNPKASEISIVLHGQGMVRVACPSSSTNSTKCKNMRFKVKEGDVFSVTRFHPMAQISFNNDSFVFMGFSTTTGRNHPQFLAGKRSVLRTLDRDVLAVSFNVTNTTIDRLLAPQVESVILDCTSCAEEEERLMKEEIEKEKEEEEAREREEEEKKREEEEAREREEEEKKREEEEEAREREEEKKREEEEARKREEEKKKREEEEEEERKRAGEEARKRAEEEARKRAEEEARKRAEEEARKRAEEEDRKREEKEKRRREEEAEREQEEARKQQEERREKRRREDEGAGDEPGKEEGEAERQQEEARKQEQGKEEERREGEGGGEPRKQQTEAEREQEEARRQQQEKKKRSGKEEGVEEPWKEDAEARSEEREKEWVKNVFEDVERLMAKGFQWIT